MGKKLKYYIVGITLAFLFVIVILSLKDGDCIYKIYRLDESRAYLPYVLFKYAPKRYKQRFVFKQDRRNNIEITTLVDTTSVNRYTYIYIEVGDSISGFLLAPPHFRARQIDTINEVNYVDYLVDKRLFSAYLGAEDHKIDLEVALRQYVSLLQEVTPSKISAEISNNSDINRILGLYPLNKPFFNKVISADSILFVNDDSQVYWFRNLGLVRITFKDNDGSRLIKTEFIGYLGNEDIFM